MPDVIVKVRVEGAEEAENELRGLGDATNEAGGQAKKATRSTDNLGSSVLGFAGGAAQATSGALGMVDSFRELERSDNKVAKSTRKASELTEKRVKAEKALADAVGGTTGQMELQIPAGKQFVQMWGDAQVQVRNANGELSTIPKVLKKVGGATKDITKLQDDVNDARAAEAIGLETNRLNTEANTAAHQRHGLVLAQEGLQIGGGIATMGAFGKSMADAAREAGPMGKSLGKVAGAAGLVGAAVGGAVVAADELSKARMADPKFAKQLEKDTKALQKFSVAGAAVPQVAKGFQDLGKNIQDAAVATIEWAVESVWPPVSDFLSSIPANLMNLAVTATAFFTWIAENIWKTITVDVPEGLKTIAVAAVATVTWIAEQVWEFFTVTVPEALQTIAVAAVATINWIAEQIWGFFTVTVPEGLQAIAVAATATINWIAEQIWGFFTVTVPETLKAIAVAAVATVTWAAEQIWGFFTVTVPEALKAVAVAATATVNWAVQQIWGFFTVTVPEALKAVAIAAQATVSWVVSQIWGFFTVTVPEALKAIAIAGQATVTWLATHIWSFITVTVPETLKKVATDGLATIRWLATHIWQFATVTVPDTLKKIATDGLATITWAIKNVFPPGSNADKAMKDAGFTNGKADAEILVDANTGEATSAIGALKSELDGIKDKEAKVTVNVQKGITPAARGRHGGTWLATGSSSMNSGGSGGLGFRNGGTNVISRPTNIRVGEGFHPELVTVTPLGKTVGHSTGSIGHPHAAVGGDFLAIGQAVTGIMENAADSVASQVKRDTEEEEKVKARKVELVQQQAFEKATKEWSQKLEQIRGEQQETRKDLMKAQSVRARASGGVQSPQAIAELNKKITDLTNELAVLTNELSIQQSKKPKTPPPVEPGTVTVDVVMAKAGFGPSMVRKPTLLMTGEAGPELVSVTPMRNGTRGGGGGRIGTSGGSGDERLERLISMFERWMQRQSGMMEANLIVDGQRMATVSEKYMGSKSYGGR